MKDGEVYVFRAWDFTHDYAAQVLGYADGDIVDRGAFLLTREGELIAVDWLGALRPADERVQEPPPPQLA
jgi:hypothetical protein